MTASCPRVLLLLHEMTLTGAPRLALSLFRSLRGDVSLRIVSIHPGPLNGAFRELGHVSTLSSVRRQGYQQAGIAGKAAARMRDQLEIVIAGRRCRSWRPTLNYVNTVEALPLVAELGMQGVPTLLHVHESSVALERFVAAHPGILAGLPNRYIAVSHVVADELTRRHGIPLTKIAVIPPFVDVPPAELSRAPSSSPWVIGGVGNPHWTKGVDLWLLAAREVVSRLGEERVRLIWVGLRDNDEARHFRAMVRKLGLEDVVELHPETPDPFSAIARFDVLAMSSWEESASMTVLEAMACSVPVVCFGGSGGPAEEVGDAGVVVPDFSPAAMGEAIAGLLLDPGRRQKMAEVARARVGESYSETHLVPLIAAQMRETARTRAK